MNKNEWEALLAQEGMPAELLRTPGRSYERFRDEILKIQEGLDAEIEQENKFPSSMPMKNGLPPCKRVQFNKRR